MAYIGATNGLCRSLQGNFKVTNADRASGVKIHTNGTSPINQRRKLFMTDAGKLISKTITSKMK